MRAERIRRGVKSHLLLLSCVVLLFGIVCIAPASASPWAEVGDNQLRSDIEILATAGIVDDITTHWPLPWTSLAADIQSASLKGQPDYVRAAAERVMRLARAQTEGGLHASATIDATNLPSVVYGFDGMGRGQGQAQLSLEFNSSNTSGRLSLGALSGNFTGRSTVIMPEGTYLAQKVGGALIYGGYLSHWWGPGWISALSLSNNARPMPQIGIERLGTTASDLPVLDWFGPWQMEFFVGLLDGQRITENTFYNALRFTFNPAPGLEIGLARTEEFCGQGHPCAPLRDYFDFRNDPAHVDKTNDEGLIDVKYSRVISGVPAQVYMQLMNEDSSPISHSATSHLFGGTIFVPASANPVRLTLEYTDSVPTVDIFSFGDVFHGTAYNNGGYPDGMRYRDRTLGFSLDSDSRLLSLQGSWTGAHGIFYELSLHHAAISNPNNLEGNVVTTAPVIVNMGEARVTLPLRIFKLDLAVRLQDDQPRPQKGFAATFETALRIGL